MHAIIKSSFYIIFIVIMIFMGLAMYFNKKNIPFYKLFGLMALVLGIGEGFYLIPRVYSLFSDDVETVTHFLDTGKLISSITIIIVFALLYKLWRNRFKISDLKWLDLSIMFLSILSVTLSLTIQKHPDFSTLSFIPYLCIGLILTIIYYKESRKAHDVIFKNIWLALVLSLLFYIPVELFEKSHSIAAILMLPRTIMYIWMISIGYKGFKTEIK